MVETGKITLKKLMQDQKKALPYISFHMWTLASNLLFYVFNLVNKWTPGDRKGATVCGSCIKEERIVDYR